MEEKPPDMGGIVDIASEPSAKAADSLDIGPTTQTYENPEVLRYRLEREKADADSERREREKDAQDRRRKDFILFVTSISATIIFFIFGVYIYYFAPGISPTDKELAKTITTIVVSGVVGYALGGKNSK